MRKRSRKHVESLILICFILLTCPSFLLASEPCYVVVENAGSFEADIVQSSAVSLVSRYIEKVEPPPPTGLRIEDCYYSVNLSESKDGIFVSLSGKLLNSVGNSNEEEIEGLTQALLRAIYRTFDSDDMKSKVCGDYAELLAADCKPVEAVVFLFNERREMLPQGSIVKENDRFNVMIQPVVDLYAYIVALDSSGSLFKIFPNPDVASQTNPLMAGSQYYFPPLDSDVIFAFDAIPGEEKLYFLLSSTPVDEIDAFFQNLEGIQSDLEMSNAVASFEKRFTTRGFKLKKKTHNVVLKKNKNADNLINKQVMAELLKGSGVLVKTVTLKHVR